MKKFFFLLFVLSAAVAGAKGKSFEYQGEVVTGWSFESEEECHHIGLDVINGIRFSNCFYAGAGVGLDMNFGDEAFLIPLYLDFKGYFPVSEKLDLMAGVDVGTKMDYFYDTSGGILFRPMFGICTAKRKNFALNIALKYELYSYRLNVPVDSSRLKTNQLGLTLGFVF